jgi:hypothetical protein
MTNSFMKVFFVLLTAALFVPLSRLDAQQPPPAATPAPSPQAVERAAAILTEARAAMGGDALAKLTSLTATGRTQRVRGNNLVPIEFEIAIEWPDKYVRRDEVPAEESGPTTNGFTGDEVIQVGAAAGPGGRGGGPAGRPGGPGPATPPSPEQLAAQNRARVIAARQEFTRLSLGLLLNSLPVYPVTFAFAAQAAAPQGTADVLDVTGAGGFAARLFINHETHLPIMVSWQTPAAPAGRGGPAAAAAPASGAATPPAGRGTPPAPVENRIYFSDYRKVDGLQLPFRIRRAVGADTAEETTFDRFRINTRIDPKKFATK